MQPDSIIAASAATIIFFTQSPPDTQPDIALIMCREVVEVSDRSNMFTRGARAKRAQHTAQPDPHRSSPF